MCRSCCAMFGSLPFLPKVISQKTKREGQNEGSRPFLLLHVAFLAFWTLIDRLQCPKLPWLLN